MKFLAKYISRYILDEQGATAIEYSLIAAAIALSIVTIVFLLGDEVVAMYDDVLVVLT